MLLFQETLSFAQILAGQLVEPHYLHGLLRFKFIQPVDDAPFHITTASGCAYFGDLYDVELITTGDLDEYRKGDPTRQRITYQDLLKGVNGPFPGDEALYKLDVAVRHSEHQKVIRIFLEHGYRVSGFLIDQRREEVWFKLVPILRRS